MRISPDRNQIIMRVPDNWHAHFRQGKFLQFLVPYFIEYGWRGRIIAEPNTLPPILTGDHANAYAGEIQKEASRFGTRSFKVVPTIQITEQTTPEMIRDAYQKGIHICKVYPRYVTTHSEHGVVDYSQIIPALIVAAQFGMIVQFHPEHPSYDVYGPLKEKEFIPVLEMIRQEVPSLRISVEHVSSKEMIQWVEMQSEYIGASITVHHLYQTLDDLIGYSKRSGGLISVDDGAFKPCAKTPEDRADIQQAALCASSKFWYGGDDAAHLKSKKHCSHPSCGAWNTIAGLSLLISLFERNNALENLERFLSENGAAFYGYPLNEKEITYRRQPWEVPSEIPVPELDDSIVPFFAGEVMEWQLVD